MKFQNFAFKLLLFDDVLVTNISRRDDSGHAIRTLEALNC